jgi:membrane-associated phospholipid phosphatase
MNSRASNFDDHRATSFSWSRFAIVALLLLAGGVVAALADVPVEQRTVNDTFGGFETTDLARMFRTAGFLPFWLVVALAIWLHRRHVTGSWRQTVSKSVIVLPVTVIAAGVLAEIVKALARRKRPSVRGLWYDFRPFTDHPFDTGGLSMPSSHTIIAFAAAFTLGRLYPGARWIFILYAAGTAFTRVHTGAHFVSDVYASAILGWVCAWAVWNHRWPVRSDDAGMLLPQADARSI